MSGHSKWSTIKHQKQANDAKRGQIFTKLGKIISVAAKEGNSGDPSTNFKLAQAIEKARAANMPKDNVKRAIDRGLGKGGAGELFSINYEGFGPEKIGVIVEVVTDNKNRTVAEVKYLFEKAGGVLGQPGAVTFMFDRAGEIVVEKQADSETQMLVIIDMAGVVDLEETEAGLEIKVKAAQLAEVKSQLEKAGFKIKSAELVWAPQNLIKIEAAKKDKVVKFLEELDDHEDVQNVFTNADF